MNRLPHIVFLTLTALLCLASCSDDSCSDNGSSLPLAALYMNGSQQTIPGLTIMGVGVKGDSLLADSASLKEIYLPLQAGCSSTSYAVSRYVTDGTDGTWLDDTLTIDYKAVEFFHSAECGAMFNFEVKGVDYTCRAIDSVEILTPTITNSRTPALRIHFTDFQQ